MTPVPRTFKRLTHSFSVTRPSIYSFSATCPSAYSFSVPCPQSSHTIMRIHSVQPVQVSVYSMSRISGESSLVVRQSGTYSFGVSCPKCLAHSSVSHIQVPHISKCPTYQSAYSFGVSCPQSSHIIMRIHSASHIQAPIHSVSHDPKCPAHLGVSHNHAIHSVSHIQVYHTLKRHT